MNLTGGPANFFPGNGKLKFDDNGHRENASLLIVQWQKGVPITVYPAKDALSPPAWPTAVDERLVTTSRTDPTSLRRLRSSDACVAQMSRQMAIYGHA